MLNVLGFSDALLHWNELADHYQEHKAEYGDDFLNFVQKHFGEQKFEHHNESNGHSDIHDELPFGHVHFDLASDWFNSEVLWVLKNTPKILNKAVFTYNWYYEFNYSKEYLDPPKFA